MKFLQSLFRRLRAGVDRERQIVLGWSFRAPSNDNDLSPRSRAFYSPQRNAS